MIHSHAPAARGFTLVETLVAITILMIAIVGPFYSLQQAITASQVSRDNLIASSLAQEGVEYVYFIRNSNYLAGRAWDAGLSSCQGSRGCMVDPTQNTISQCATGSWPAGGCAALRLSPTGLYTQSGSYPTTRFTRKVEVQTVSATQMKVVVTVLWSTNRANYSIVLTEDLYNWL